MARVRVALRRQIQPFGEAVEDRLGRQQAGPCSRELERKGQTVEALAEPRHRLRRLDRGVDTPSTVDEEGRRLVQRERGKVEPCLGGDVERLATRHHETKSRRCLDDRREHCCHARKQLLDVVEHQMGTAPAYPRRDPLRRHALGSERACNRRQDERRVAERRKGDEDRAAVRVLRDQARQLDREPGLARASRAENCQDRRRLGDDERHRVVQLALAAEKRGRRGRQEHSARRSQRGMSVGPEL